MIPCGHVNATSAKKLPFSDVPILTRQKQSFFFLVSHRFDTEFVLIVFPFGGDSIGLLVIQSLLVVMVRVSSSCKLSIRAFNSSVESNKTVVDGDFKMGDVRCRCSALS
mmetsp:Transcript_6435/g.13418  ORF Transcript_6435/g.13418 Transcript_6435/m.13418 type:complete len:109 (+) Transcript_6435:216-542(+)